MFEPKTKPTPINKLCPFSPTVIMGAGGQALVVKGPCPQTSKSNIITQAPYCPDWDESKKECKWILMRDAILGMTSGIIRPA